MIVEAPVELRLIYERGFNILRALIDILNPITSFWCGYIINCISHQINFLAGS